MALFLLNVCKFNNCGIQFNSLSDLIHHIEDTHIDNDPNVIEQKEQSQPACLPLSYVLRFITDSSTPAPQTPTPITPTTPVTAPTVALSTPTRKEQQIPTQPMSLQTPQQPVVATANAGGNSGAGTEVKRKLAIKHHSYSLSSSNRSTTPTGSEIDDEESMMVSESEDSDNSWTNEEYSSEFIMRYGSRHSSGGTGSNSSNEKPFVCPVPGCKKRYKNVNGIKYHSKNGHKKDGKFYCLNRVRKGYKCHCGKSYKTSQGLKTHNIQVHQRLSVSPSLVTMSTLDTITNSHHHSRDNRAGSPVSNSSSSTSSSFNSPLAGIGQSSSSSNAVTPPSSTSFSSSITTLKGNNQLGLVTIKQKPGLVSLSSNKIVKIVSDTKEKIKQEGKLSTSSSSSSSSCSSSNNNNNGTSSNTHGKGGNGTMGGSSSSNSNNNGESGNGFGILTPATSPQLFQQQQQPQKLNVKTNNINNSNQNDNHLPLTPISPNTSNTTGNQSNSNHNSINLTNQSNNNNNSLDGAFSLSDFECNLDMDESGT